jgi:hypothetical protein
MSSSPLIKKSPANAFEGSSREMKDLGLGAEHAEHAGGVEWAELIRSPITRARPSQNRT